MYRCLKMREVPVTCTATWTHVQIFAITQTNSVFNSRDVSDFIAVVASLCY